MNKRAFVSFEKEYLTGLLAGRRVRGHVMCVSRAEASRVKRDMSEAKVDSGEFSGDLFKYRDVRVVSVAQTLNLK